MEIDGSSLDRVIKPEEKLICTDKIDFDETDDNSYQKISDNKFDNVLIKLVDENNAQIVVKNEVEFEEFQEIPKISKENKNNDTHINTTSVLDKSSSTKENGSSSSIKFVCEKNIVLVKNNEDNNQNVEDFIPENKISIRIEKTAGNKNLIKNIEIVVNDTTENIRVGSNTDSSTKLLKSLETNVQFPTEEDNDNNEKKLKKQHFEEATSTITDDLNFTTPQNTSTHYLIAENKPISASENESTINYTSEERDGNKISKSNKIMSKDSEDQITNRSLEFDTKEDSNKFGITSDLKAEYSLTYETNNNFSKEKYDQNNKDNKMLPVISESCLKLLGTNKSEIVFTDKPTSGNKPQHSKVNSIDSESSKTIFDSNLSQRKITAAIVNNPSIDLKVMRNEMNSSTTINILPQENNISKISDIVRQNNIQGIIPHNSHNNEQKDFSDNSINYLIHDSIRSNQYCASSLNKSNQQQQSLEANVATVESDAKNRIMNKSNKQTLNKFYDLVTKTTTTQENSNSEKIKPFQYDNPFKRINSDGGNFRAHPQQNESLHEYQKSFHNFPESSYNKNESGIQINYQIPETTTSRNTNRINPNVNDKQNKIEHYDEYQKSFHNFPTSSSSANKKGNEIQTYPETISTTSKNSRTNLNDKQNKIDYRHLNTATTTKSIHESIYPGKKHHLDSGNRLKSEPYSQEPTNNITTANSNYYQQHQQQTKMSDFNASTTSKHLMQTTSDAAIKLKMHKYAPYEINSKNFAEISKKYNYIEDLQLKNPDKQYQMTGKLTNYMEHGGQQHHLEQHPNSNVALLSSNHLNQQARNLNYLKPNPEDSKTQYDFKVRQPFNYDRQLNDQKHMALNDTMIAQQQQQQRNQQMYYSSENFKNKVGTRYPVSGEVTTSYDRNINSNYHTSYSSANYNSNCLGMPASYPSTEEYNKYHSYNGNKDQMPTDVKYFQKNTDNTNSSYATSGVSCKTVGSSSNNFENQDRNFYTSNKTTNDNSWPQTSQTYSNEAASTTYFPSRSSFIKTEQQNSSYEKNIQHNTGYKCSPPISFNQSSTEETYAAPKNMANSVHQTQLPQKMPYVPNSGEHESYFQKYDSGTKNSINMLESYRKLNSAAYNPVDFLLQQQNQHKVIPKPQLDHVKNISPKTQSSTNDNYEYAAHSSSFNVGQQQHLGTYYPENRNYVPEQNTKPIFAHHQQYDSSLVSYNNKQQTAQIPQNHPALQIPLSVPSSSSSSPSPASSTTSIKRRIDSGAQIGSCSSSINKNQKPNYRELINNYYAMKQSTTEDDLNLKIIQRTLNFNPPKQNQTDLESNNSKNLPSSESKNQIIKCVTPTELQISQLKMTPTEVVSKNNDGEEQLRQQQHQQEQQRLTPQQCDRNNEYVTENSFLKNSLHNDINVTISRVSPYHLVVGNNNSKVNNMNISIDNTSNSKTNKTNNMNDGNKKTPKNSNNEVISQNRILHLQQQHQKVQQQQHPKQQQHRQQQQQKQIQHNKEIPLIVPTTITNPENILMKTNHNVSPLDLSVKTVKTKADSTGCFSDVVSSYRQKNENSSTISVPKINFLPNFANVGQSGGSQQMPTISHYQQQHNTNNDNNKNVTINARTVVSKNYYRNDSDNNNKYRRDNNNVSATPYSHMIKHDKLPLQHQLHQQHQNEPIFNSTATTTVKTNKMNNYDPYIYKQYQYQQQQQQQQQYQQQQQQQYQQQQQQYQKQQHKDYYNNNKSQTPSDNTYSYTDSKILQKNCQFVNVIKSNPVMKEKTPNPQNFESTTTSHQQQLQHHSIFSANFEDQKVSVYPVRRNETLPIIKSNTPSNTDKLKATCTATINNNNNKSSYNSQSNDHLQQQNNNNLHTFKNEKPFLTKIGVSAPDQLSYYCDGSNSVKNSYLRENVENNHYTQQHVLLQRQQQQQQENQQIHSSKNFNSESLTQNVLKLKQTEKTYPPDMRRKFSVIQTMSQFSDNSDNSKNKTLTTETINTNNTISHQYQSKMLTEAEKIQIQNLNMSNNINSYNDFNKYDVKAGLNMNKTENNRISNYEVGGSDVVVPSEHKKSDIASLLAARIRTKGELKVFVPPPINSTSSNSNTSTKEQVTSTTTTITPPISLQSSLSPSLNMMTEQNNDDFNGLNLNDWNFTCNDFVEQLTNGSAKKRTKKRKLILQQQQKKENKEQSFVENSTSTLENFPGIEYNGDVDRKLIEELKLTANLLDETVANETETDEDKPLNLLRQHHNRKPPQVLDEVKLIKKIKEELNDDDTTAPPSIKDENSSTHHSTDSKTEKLGRREKQRIKQEKRLAARIGRSSSSESDQDDKTQNPTQQRNKKIRKFPRKPRTTIKSELQIGNNDSSTVNENESSNDSTNEKKNWIFSSVTKNNNNKEISIESRKRKLTESTSLKDSFEPFQRKRNSLLKPFETAMMTKAEMKYITPVKEEELSLVDPLKIDETSKNLVETTTTDSNEKPKKNSKQKSSSSKKSINVTDDDDIEGDVNDEKKQLPKETMTRSKKRKQIEMQIANSKILRNYKVIGSNSGLTKAALMEVTTKTSPPSIESMRLRSKRIQDQNKSVGKSPLKLKSKEKSSVTKQNENSKIIKKTNRISSASFSTFPPGWEHQVYEYKKSLKVPLSLISVKGPPVKNSSNIGSNSSNKKSSTATMSLPDLDSHSSDFSEISEKIQEKLLLTPQALSVKRQLFTENIAAVGATLTTLDDEDDEKLSKNKTGSKNKPASIIDLLHSRVVPSKIARKTANRLALSASTAASTNSLGGKKNIQSNETELLSAPVVNSTNTDDSLTSNVIDGKNNVFKTEVLKSRTRTESKTLKRKELIREVFGGDDRPASAPPDIENVSFEEKYQQFLKKLNTDFGGGDLDRAVDLNMLNEMSNCKLPYEEGIHNVPKKFVKLKKGNKYRNFRRKGSSGFDYIRKKKKTPTLTSSSQNLMKKRKISSILEVCQPRDENDVSKEIQKWVLNKSVGQSALHKAARLGYLDVIAYCLERMSMNPNSKDNAGYTPLHEACSKGRLDIARILLEYGANHSEAAHSGIRPLHEAIENGFVEIARLLLSYGADPLLTTYAGQTPLMMAEDVDMEYFIKSHLNDVQQRSIKKDVHKSDKKNVMQKFDKTWKFPGAWQTFDPDENGFNIFDGASNQDDKYSAVNKIRTTNLINKSPLENSGRAVESKLYEKLKMNCYVTLCKNISDSSEKRSVLIESIDNTENEDIFEFEESETPLPPLYTLRDEGLDKWILLNDLCVLLKVKSKDTLLKQIYPCLPPPAVNKDVLRELKISEFLEKAICLQLLSAGEKLNIRSSKITLIKYNDRVKDLLGVTTVSMKV